MKLLKSYIVAIPFLVGGYLGYKSPVAKHDLLLAAIIGAVIGGYAGVHLLLVLWPRETFAEFTTKGLEKGTATFVPISGIVVSCVLYIVSRNLLKSPEIWKPAIIVVLVTGVAALVRIKISRLPD